MCERAFERFVVSHEEDRKYDRSHSYSAISALSTDRGNQQLLMSDRRTGRGATIRLAACCSYCTYLACPRTGEGVIFAAVADWSVDKEHDLKGLLMLLSGTFVSCQTTAWWLQQLERKDLVG